MSPLDALSRTILLARDFVRDPEASDQDIVDALMSITVAIVADAATVELPATQTAIAALAAQVAAYGARLRLVFPNTRMRSPQPPLRGEYFRDALVDFAGDLVPGGSAVAAEAPDPTDLVFVIGNTSIATPLAATTWRVGWTKWSGLLRAAYDAVPEPDVELPVGALVSATLAAAEPFKHVVRELLAAAGVVRTYDELSATHLAEVKLAPEDTEVTKFDFGHIDIVSGGAIANAFLHALLRIPKARAVVRVFEPETLDASNLNRYALARRSFVGGLKTRMLEGWQTNAVAINGQATRFDERTPSTMRRLAPTVFVGTDDIPSRWFVQALQPEWLCVGATTHFTAMASEHNAESACAGCLHPEDDDVNAPIATVSFVSYWAGLLLLVRLLRKHSTRPVRETERVVEVAALQAGAERGIWLHRVNRNARCPLRCLRAA
jgi:hypothetical protein